LIRERLILTTPMIAAPNVPRAAHAVTAVYAWLHALKPQSAVKKIKTTLSNTSSMATAALPVDFALRHVLAASGIWLKMNRLNNIGTRIK